MTNTEKDGIFEIREYLDDHDVVSNHEVLDITRELEYMEHLHNQVDSSTNSLNEDDEFIRELSIISDEHSLTTSNNSELIDRLGKFELSENNIKEKSSTQKPLNWGKGFLNKTNKINQTKPIIKDKIVSNTNLNDVATLNSKVQDEKALKMKDIPSCTAAFNGNIFERLAPSS